MNREELEVHMKKFYWYYITPEEDKLVDKILVACPDHETEIEKLLQSIFDHGRKK